MNSNLTTDKNKSRQSNCTNEPNNIEYTLSNQNKQQSTNNSFSTKTPHNYGRSQIQHNDTPKIHQQIKSNKSEAFHKALNYIAIYQERFHKTAEATANGRICELVSEQVSSDHFIGSLKFYNEKAKFGFVRGDDGVEVFVHKDNLIKSRIDSQMLEICTQFFEIRLKYQTLAYKGKGNPSSKAVNIDIINFVPKSPTLSQSE